MNYELWNVSLFCWKGCVIYSGVR